MLIQTYSWSLRLASPIGALRPAGPLAADADFGTAQVREDGDRLAALGGGGPDALVDLAMLRMRAVRHVEAEHVDAGADEPVEGIGLDFHRQGADLARTMEREGPKNVELIAEEGGLDRKWLFAGIVDGRNVWINELEHSLDLLGGLRDRCAELVVSTSCSLLHTPVDLNAEPPSEALDDELRSWMAFARQKVGEVATLSP